MIYINSWIGRLGNNITQIVNALYFAHYKKINIIKLPYHPLFMIREIIIGDVITNKSDKFSHNFFSRRKIISFYEVSDNIFENKINIKKYLQNLIKYDILKENINDNDLTIHIRSGDVYSKHPHPGWIQPPLSFYINIIESNNWENIFIISEDNKSPVLKPLLNKYKKIIFEIRDLKKDIYYILNSKNVCFGLGSFIPSLLLFNNNIKKIYYPEYCHRFLIDLIDYENKYTYKLDNYIKKGEWKNTSKQRNIIINYELKII